MATPVPAQVQSDTPIFTLNARGNVMLEVMRDYFKLSTSDMRKEIEGMHRETIGILAAKGIQYQNLRNALVPSTDRHEICLIFDQSRIKSTFYGTDAFKHYFPLLDKRAPQCVLVGDFIGDDQKLIYELLEESICLVRDFTFRHGSNVWCVYINNLSEYAIKQLSNGLMSYPAYVGFIPTTYASRAKAYLSAILPNAFLKVGNKVVIGHEDDVPNEENSNLIGYPFEQYGFEIRSLQSMYCSTMLSYKIERPVVSGFEVDTEMSLNAMSEDVRTLSSMEIELDDAKHGYLVSEKRGSLRRAGIADFNRLDLAKVIRSKMAANYIYNMTYLSKHDVAKFNIVLEIPHASGGFPTRLLAALEYMPAKNKLRVITLY